MKQRLVKKKRVEGLGSWRLLGEDRQRWGEKEKKSPVSRRRETDLGEKKEGHRGGGEMIRILAAVLGNCIGKK